MSVKIYENIVSKKGIDYLLTFLNKKDEYYQEGQFVRKQGFDWSKNNWPRDWTLALLKRLEIKSNPYAIMMIDLDHQLGIHTDTINGSKCDKNIVIPLEIVEPAQTVIFKNKWYGTNMNLSLENKKELDFLTDDPFDRTIHSKYLSTFDYELLQGLKIEDIYDWKVGSVCVFDSSHLHTNSTISKYKKAVYIWTTH